MKNIGTTLFAPHPGERPETAKARIDSNRRVFREALDTPAGRALVRLLYSASHPLAPRFLAGETAEQAAFLDGERHLIGLLWLNGVSEPTMNKIDQP
jgi:hypothetical protein